MHLLAHVLGKIVVVLLLWLGFAAQAAMATLAMAGPGGLTER
jgi:hypothetical protein